MKCPKCGNETEVVCLGKRHTMYPVGCLAILGPVIATIHQASSPIDYQCHACGHSFGKRSAAAKICLAAFVLLIAYFVLIAL